jgi:DNA segregation ATPase FtsK/SpoIIIE, S-DNA-T family
MSGMHSTAQGVRMARDPYRRHMRRMRRQMRKDGNPYGMFIVSPAEPIGYLIVAAIARWTFRHRSELAPFNLALAAFIAASVAHWQHRGWWVPMTIATSVVTILLGFPHSVLRRTRAGRVIARILARAWAMCGIDRASERAYAASVIAAAGGWLSAATVNGPITPPLPWALLIATVILGIPWWIHRRRRARVRVERKISGWPELSGQAGLAGSRIGSVVVDSWGWTARVILRKGETPQHAIAKIPEIESALGVRPGSVHLTPDDSRADAFVMRVTENDPHAESVAWPGARAASIVRPVEIGVTEDGRPVSVLLLRRHALIAGATGSGKSGVLNVIIAALAACHDVVLWGVDLKGGMELQPWESCFDRLAVTPEEANELLRDAVRWLNRRAREKAAQGKRLLDPAPYDPALVIVIDEYAELPEEARDCADSIGRRGRAIAVNLIAATQKPTQAAMGKDSVVRSQMDVRISLRVRERRDVDLIIGQGSLASGWHAHQFTKPGEFLLSDPEHTTPQRCRAYLLTDDRIARHARACAPIRPALPAGGPDTPQTATGAPQHGAPMADQVDEREAAEAALWAALRGAGPHGVTVIRLMAVTGMGRSWVYYRLGELADAGRVVQVARGVWRAAGADGQ